MGARYLRLGPMYLLTVALALALTACGGARGVASTSGDTHEIASPSPTPAKSALDGTEWLLTSLEGRPLINGTQITLSFYAGTLDEHSKYYGTISGNSTCNHYTVSYSAHRGVLELGEGLPPDGMVSTARPCEHAVDQEGTYQVTLQDVVGYRMTGNRLELMDAQGRTTLEFKRHREQ